MSTSSPIRRLLPSLALGAVMLLQACAKPTPSTDDTSPPTGETTATSQPTQAVIPPASTWEAPPPPLPVAPAAQTTLQTTVEFIANMMEDDAPDLEAFFTLVHPETEEQEVWLDAARLLHLPRYRMWLASKAYFGDEIPQGFDLGRLIKEDVTIDGDDRGSITMACSGGWYTPMHFVKVDDNWYISGNTFQHAEQHFGLFRLADKTATENRTSIALSRDTAREVEAFAERIRAGEFATVELMQEAQREIMRQAMLDAQDQRRQQ